MIKIVLIISMIMSLLSCGNKTEQLSKEEKTTESISQNVKLEKLGYISNSMNDSVYIDQLTDLAIDENHNIYVLDSKKSQIHKFNYDGKFVNSMCNYGSGPGELKSPSFLYINQDTLFVMSAPTQSMEKFSLNGSYYGKKMVVGAVMSQPFVYHQQKFVGYKLEPSAKSLNMKLNIWDMDYNNSVELKNYQNDINTAMLNIFDICGVFTLSNNFVYAATKSKNQYQIDVFDFQGKKVNTLSRAYRKVKYNQDENEFYQNYYGKLYAKMNMNNFKWNKSFKNSIQKMYTDDQNRLWVIPAIDRDKYKEEFLVDIFSDKSVFLGRNHIPLFSQKSFQNVENFSLYFKNQKLYLADKEENSITIYNYELSL